MLTIKELLNHGEDVLTRYPNLSLFIHLDRKCFDK